MLDGVRAISIALVLAGHMLPLGPKPWQMNIVAAQSGMALFFTLSGFLITRFLLANDDLFEFFVKRFTRIMPLAFLYMLTVFVLFDHSVPVLAHDLSFTLNYADQYLDDWNPHLWSLCVEVQFYLLMGLVFRMMKGQAPAAVLALCLIVTAIKIGTQDLSSMKSHLRGDELLAGSLLALSLHGTFGDGAKFWRRTAPFTPLLAVLLLASAHPRGGFLVDLRAYLSALLVGSVIFTRNAPLKRVLTSSPLRYLARVSYAVYIIHIATKTGWLNSGPKWELYLVKRPISFTITFVLAHLSTFHYEAWGMERGRRWIAARRERVAARPVLARAL